MRPIYVALYGYIENCTSIQLIVEFFASEVNTKAGFQSMKFIATDVSDSLEKMADRLEESMAKARSSYQSPTSTDHIWFTNESWKT